jgi:putative ABC transport system ATP-binding protein
VRKAARRRAFGRNRMSCSDEGRRDLSLATLRPPMPQPVVSLRAVRKSVREGASTRPILDGVDFELLPRSSCAVVGRSGSGKSTLLNLTAGLDQPDSGSVQLMGEELGGKSEAERAALRQRHVGFVFQSFHLLPTLTALENVQLPLELGRQPAAAARSRAMELLEAVGLADRAGAYPAVLSGGEQQRLAVARALSTSPALVLADEPTGNLDDESAQQVLDLLFALVAERGGSLLLVTHAAAVAARCERRVRLEHGRLRSEP